MTQRIDPGRLPRRSRKGRRFAERSLSGDGSDRALKQAVTVLGIALKRAGFGDSRRTCRPSERMRGPHT